jgi:hypothetical protein
MYSYVHEYLQAVNEYFRTGDIFWENCVGICTDGAVTVTGGKKGKFLTRELYTVRVSFQRGFSIT